jgi:Co/Zn/Cd efflux system component
MDCPSEERLIRLALDGLEAVQAVEFDLPGRRLVVVHGGAAAPVLARLAPLGLGAALVESAAVAPAEVRAAAPAAEAAREASTLRLVLALNAAMFAVEVVAGWLAQSTGLLADSLDMLADAAVYGLALRAVGRSAALQQRAARLAGVLQVALAAGAMADVVRRLLTGSAPEPGAMAGVSLLALLVNATCLWLLTRHRGGGLHVRASVIFSASDVLANLGVMAAGALVAVTGSRLPDLAIGAAVAGMVLLAGVRILRLR